MVASPNQRTMSTATTVLVAHVSGVHLISTPCMVPCLIMALNTGVER